MATNYKAILDSIVSSDEKLVVEVLILQKEPHRQTDKNGVVCLDKNGNEILVRDFRAKVIYPEMDKIIKGSIKETKYQNDMVMEHDCIVVFGHDVNGKVYYNYAFSLE